MDSINRQQPEDNYEPLEGSAAIKKMQDLSSKASTCFFCTGIETGKPFRSRPMAFQKVDDQGNFWFLSAKDSFKNEELKHDPMVQLLSQGSDHTDFLHVYGKATVSDDRSKIDELWNPIMKTWFTEGKDDPRISVIKVQPYEGYYWDTKHHRAVAFFKQLVGAAIGKTLDDSIEGELLPR